MEEVFGVREVTIRTWLCRSGMQGKKLHERIMAELQLVHVQLDKLWANVKNRGQNMLWIASDVMTKIIPVMQVGARNQEMAYSVAHELKRMDGDKLSARGIYKRSRMSNASIRDGYVTWCRARVRRFVGIIAPSPSKFMPTENYS